MGPTMRELRPDGPAWFGLRARYQHERSTESALGSVGVETFLPLFLFPAAAGPIGW